MCFFHKQYITTMHFMLSRCLQIEFKKKHWTLLAYNTPQQINRNKLLYSHHRNRALFANRLANEHPLLRSFITNVLSNVLSPSLDPSPAFALCFWFIKVCCGNKTDRETKVFVLCGAGAETFAHFIPGRLLPLLHNPGVRCNILPCFALPGTPPPSGQALPVWDAFATTTLFSVQQPYAAVFCTLLFFLVK